LANEFDILILDTPAAADTADAQAITMRAGRWADCRAQKRHTGFAGTRHCPTRD
jgi:hypothetical protein